jgi:hypothetical protein
MSEISDAIVAHFQLRFLLLRLSAIVLGVPAAVHG